MPETKFRYVVQCMGETLAGFVHRPDAERYQAFRCGGLACSPEMYPIIDIIPLERVEIHGPNCPCYDCA
jgi:hypothetical protein